MILGQVLSAAQGQNPARQAAMKAGVPKEKTAFGLNQLCGSGLRAVAIGLQQIANGDANIIVAGGQESMSLAPHAAYLRSGVKMGEMKMLDTMLQDGLIDAFHGYHMGNTAENISAKWQINRESQDRFAVVSKQGRSCPEGRQVQGRDRSSDHIDAQGRHRGRHRRVSSRGATYDAMAKLRPAFSKDGTVTAGNASGLNDGAAALVVMSAAEAKRRGISPMARIVSWATADVDPAIMGTGPIPATRKALEKAGWSVRISIWWKPTRLSPPKRWRSIRISAGTLRSSTSMAGRFAGHPIGASGARVLTTLLHEMVRRNAKKGLATLCIGGGMGIAMAVER